MLAHSWPHSYWTIVCASSDLSNLKASFVCLTSGYGFQPDSPLMRNLKQRCSLCQNLDRQWLPLCQFSELCHSLYLARSHLGLLLATLLAVGLQLGEAELPEQVTGAAQQVAWKAQLPACFRRQLGAKRRQLERGRKDKSESVEAKVLSLVLDFCMQKGEDIKKILTGLLGNEWEEMLM